MPAGTSQTVKVRALDPGQWLRLPFWRRMPVGYEEPHRSPGSLAGSAAWTMWVKDGVFFCHGRGGVTLLAFWYGTSPSGQRAFGDGRRFYSSPLRALGFVRSYYPMVDWVDTSPLADND